MGFNSYKILIFAIISVLTVLSCGKGKISPEIIEDIKEKTLGEIGLMYEKELNPTLIESSIQEVEILTARSPIYNEESEILNEIEKEFNFTLIAIPEKEIRIIVNLGDYIKEIINFSNRYVEIVKYTFSSVEWLKKCHSEGKIKEDLSCISENPTISIDCQVNIDRCELGNFIVSGNVYIKFEKKIEEIALNEIFSFSVSTLKFEEKDNPQNYIEFVTGTISGRTTTLLGSFLPQITTSTTSQGVIINDSKRNIRFSSREIHETFEIHIGIKQIEEIDNLKLEKLDEAKELFTVVNGTLGIYRREENLFFISASKMKIKDDIGNEAIVDAIYKRERDIENKSVSRYYLVSAEFLLPVKSLFFENMLYYKISKEETEDSRTFSLEITSYIKEDKQMQRSIEHNLKVIKKDKSKFINGKTEIRGSDKRKIKITSNALEIVEGCPVPKSGIAEAEIEEKDGIKAKAEISFKEGCLCNVEAKIQVDKIKVKLAGDVCEAKKKIKIELLKNLKMSIKI